MLDVMSGLLSEVGEGSPPDAFFSRLCEAICRLTSMRRAVLFRYDGRRRRVRAVGAHGMDLDVFADLFVTLDSVPFARAALLEDGIQEVVGSTDFKVPQHIQELFAGVRMICTPMAAAGRHVGVVLSEREAGAAEMDDSERHLHDALIEDSFDRAIAEVSSTTYEPTRWSWRVRGLRWLSKRAL
jgi:hypothetical protein